MSRSLKLFPPVVGLLSALLLGSPAWAAHGAQLKLLPPGGGHDTAPRMGFDSYFNGYGEVITHVHSGSPAEYLGLERGDTIIAVNGARLRYDGHWRRLMGFAARQGCATLAVRDWRTGAIRFRHYEFAGPVITPKLGPVHGPGPAVRGPGRPGPGRPVALVVPEPRHDDRYASRGPHVDPRGGASLRPRGSAAPGITFRIGF